MERASIETVRRGLRALNRKAGVLKTDPYGIGLPLSHCSALVDIERQGELRPGELIPLLLLDKSTISRIIASLEAKALIKVSIDQADARGKILSLTGKGKKLVAIIDEASQHTVRELLTKLTSQEREVVTEGFRLIIQAIEK